MRRRILPTRARAFPRIAAALAALALLAILGAASARLAEPASGAPRSLAANDGVVHSDFNSDGYADLAVSAPSETVGGKFQAGAVHVIYGGPQGLRADGSQLFTQSSPGVSGDPERGDFFGLSLAAGDFDADGFADLAIGVPLEDLGSTEDAGIVEILHGSSAGLVPRTSFSWTGATGEATCRCRFGEALAAGDFNDDGKADLAIGAPRRPGTSFPFEGRLRLSLGAVVVLYGSSRDRGLRVTGRTVLRPPNDGGNFLTDYVQQWWPSLMGAALAAGDHDGDGDDDLAVGIPDMSLVAPAFLPSSLISSGGVVLYEGSSRGVKTGGRIPFVFQEDFGSTAHNLDHFGSVLAFGDFDGNTREELVIGAPDEDVAGKSDAGAVYVVRDFKARLGTRWRQTTAIGGTPDAGDMFGYALATGDLNGDFRDELLVGVPFEDISGKTNAGIVHVLRGASTGPTASGSLVFHQDRPGIAGAIESSDLFGYALSARNFGGNARGQLVHSDIAIGVPGEKLSGRARAGAVHVLFGSSSGPSGTGSQFWSENSTGIADSPQAGDWFGQVLP